jgi:exosortase
MNGKSDSVTPAGGPGFMAELRQCWEQLPNKGFFFTLLAAWLLLFQFLGSCTFGYIATSSLFHWMLNAYWNPAFRPDDLGVWGLLRAYWNGEMSDDGHGLLIPVLFLVLLWWKRKLLLAQPLRLWSPALLMLALALVLHLVGYLVQQQRISIVGLFLGIYALMGLAWGPALLRTSFFPFLLFAFCIPVATIAQPITFPLRVLVCKAVVVVSPLLGFDVVRDGTALMNFQHTYQYDVAPACSGMRSLIAVFCIATIYGFVSFERPWKRLLIMASAVPLAVVSNVIRMLCIVIAAEVGGQKTGDFVHENWFFSLMPYVPAIVGVMLIGYWLRDPDLEPALPMEPKPV